MKNYTQIIFAVINIIVVVMGIIILTLVINWLLTRNKTTNSFPVQTGTGIS